MRFLKAIHLILTLHCDESERLISQALDEQLAWPQRTAVRMHFISCKYCRRFRKHVELIREASRRTTAAAISITNLKISPEARQRIMDAIRGASK
jgi:hypothetical protein